MISRSNSSAVIGLSDFTVVRNLVARIFWKKRKIKACQAGGQFGLATLYDLHMVAESILVDPLTERIKISRAREPSGSGAFYAPPRCGESIRSTPLTESTKVYAVEQASVRGSGHGTNGTFDS